jgi:uncharacterized protein
MLVLVHCIDKPGSADLRKNTRIAHLEYMIAAKSKITFGGPLLSDDGSTAGSAFAINVESHAEFEEFLAGEPYCQAGLFEKVQVHSLRQMMPENPEGLLDRELANERQRRSVTS